MKKITLLLPFLVLLLTSCGTTDNVTGTMEKQPVDWPFYEIRSNNTINGYILGSIHIGKNDWYPFPIEITDAINNSSKIFSEVKYSSAFSQNSFNYQSNTEAFDKYLLNNLFSRNETEELAKIASDYKLTKLNIDQMTLSDFYSQLQGATLNQQDVIGGVDYRIYEYLQKNNRLTDNIGFETVTEQYLLLNKSLESKLHTNTNVYWINLIPNNAEAIKQKEQSLSNYVEGNIQQEVDEMVIEPLFDQKILIEERQTVWLQTLLQQLSTDKQIFTIVGAAHLYGEKGLLTELKNAGYSTSKINITSE